MSISRFDFPYLRAMLFTAKGLALLMAGGIAFLTGVFLLFFETVSWQFVVTEVVFSFLVSFVLMAVVLEAVIFRKLAKLNKKVAKLYRKQPDDEVPTDDPVERISRGLHLHVDRLERQIEDLKKQELFRKEFIADVSHELKTPLFAAQGFVHTLLDGAMDDKKVRAKFLKKAARSLDGLDNLLQDLLTLSQIETGQVKMHIAEIDLYALAQQVLEQFEVRAGKKEVALRLEGPVRNLWVRADEEKISRVMSNLISNAINHSPAGKKVRISFREKKNSIVTRISDSGEGIPAEHIHRIFERFYRTDKSRSREKGGTGLGLAIVKHILEGHGSEAKVKSVPGKGATFSFRLPKARLEKTEDGEHKTAAEN